MIGRTISHYRILEKLGEGGMGKVYAAEDTHLDRKIALKVLPDALGGDPSQLERFRREAKAIATLNHPNIITVHSVETAEGVCFFTMELVDGATLDDRIPSDGLSLRVLFDLALPLVDAVQAAHDRGVIHRDLKPGNIMVTSDGRLKVLDFGLAKIMAHDVTVALDPAPTAPLTEAGIAIGTIPYMSPEQLQGSPIDARSDIFSLGIILFEMAAGRRPFRSGSPAETASSILRDAPDSIPELRPELPPQLGRVVDRCLEKDPVARFQTAHDLGIALKDLRDETSRKPSSKPSSASTGTARATRRQMIAVLPFENLGDPEDAYFADGISEEITSRLAAVSELGVISRTSAFQYDTGGKTVKEIGGDLGVDFLLEGTVRWDRRGDGPSRVRITPQLICVADDTHCWSDRYDRVLEDVFAVQTDIAKKVIEELGATILESEEGGLEAKPTENLIAYQAFLRGRECLNNPVGSATHDKQAIQMLEQAVSLDPSFALAYVELSDAHLSLYFYGADRTPSRLAAAKTAVEKALALQPSLAAAHVALGYYYYHGHLDYERALEAFAVAAQSLPSDATVLAAVGYIWRRQGLMEQALVNLEQAAELSPQDHYLLCQIGTTYLDMRRYEDAVRWCERSIAVQPDQHVAYLWETLAHWGRGDLQAARTTLERSPDRPSPPRTWLWYLQEMLERNPEAAVDRLAEFPEERIEQQYVFAPKDLLAGIAYRQMNDTVRAQQFCERALTVLEEAARDRPDDPRIRISLGRALAEVGRTQDAIREGEFACELSPVSRDAVFGPHCIVGLARILVVCGELDAALDRIEYLLSINSYLSVQYLKLDPDFDPLREHPRYTRIIASS